MLSRTCPEQRYVELRAFSSVLQLTTYGSQASLTSARTTANSIYCPPLLQAQLDLQSGIVNADDKDYKTAYSYFFEAFEGLGQYDTKDPRALRALKYMLLCKIMMSLVSDVCSIPARIC